MKNPIFNFTLLLVICGISLAPNDRFNSSTEAKKEIQPTIGAFRTITYASQDGIKITADLYEVSKEKTYILLCHQAGYSRGEYRQTAIMLNRLGYNCLAIDQRSGDRVNGVINVTAKEATAKALPTKYLDAQKDIMASINFLDKFTTKPIILLGSSYSASLVLMIAAKHKKIGAVISYSPGEYFKGVKVALAIEKLNKPVYVTSSKAEAEDVAMLFGKVNPEFKTQFVPKREGDHGSKVLWQQYHGQKEYWDSLKEFLKQLQDS
ncbi:MAG TPA: hypothetical protein EYN38_00110 [Flavobacteriales bacterium]|nr:hypothetical protein [Flavobacteriales bacterium]